MKLLQNSKRKLKMVRTMRAWNFSNKRALVTAIPLIFVNIVAFAGQFGYIQEHVNWPTIGQVILALALETIALFLAYMAHQALVSEDSAYGLRLASYGAGVLIGLLNYSHYAGAGFAPTFLAVATGLMSMASPWLWGIYSRRQDRDRLKANNLLEPRSVKLGSLRWLLWTPQSWHVFRQAVWSAENDPKRAVAQWGMEQPEGGHDIALPLPGARTDDLITIQNDYDDSEAAWQEETKDAREANGLPIEPPSPFEVGNTVHPMVGVEGEEPVVIKKDKTGIRTPKIIPVKSHTVKSKTQAIKDILSNSPNATIAEVINKLYADGYSATPGYVSTVKQRMKKK
jgi:hypothetical protein